jgi:glycosyltransferase involved in cell wall biosynthesis
MTEQDLDRVFKLNTSREQCPSCGFEGEIHHFPGAPLNEYPQVIASRGWNIALAPVINNGFGNCKSDIKIKEYSAAGIPIVASRVVPYKEASKLGADIVFADTYEEWYSAIKDLVKKPKLRDEIVSHNREWMSKNWIQDNAQLIFAVYAQIIAKAESVLGKKEARP